jgi:hypothetical protein
VLDGSAPIARDPRTGLGVDPTGLVAGEANALAGSATTKTASRPSARQATLVARTCQIIRTGANSQT